MQRLVPGTDMTKSMAAGVLRAVSGGGRRAGRGNMYSAAVMPSDSSG
jgi:hypothetical protein